MWLEKSALIWKIKTQSQRKTNNNNEQHCLAAARFNQVFNK